MISSNLKVLIIHMERRGLEHFKASHFQKKKKLGGTWSKTIAVNKDFI